MSSPLCQRRGGIHGDDHTASWCWDCSDRHIKRTSAHPKFLPQHIKVTFHLFQEHLPNTLARHTLQDVSQLYLRQPLFGGSEFCYTVCKQRECNSRAPCDVSWTTAEIIRCSILTQVLCSHCGEATYYLQGGAPGSCGQTYPVSFRTAMIPRK